MLQQAKLVPMPYRFRNPISRQEQEHHASQNNT